MLSMLVLVMLSSYARKPLVGSWFADDVKNWAPGALESDQFNRASVELQPRFEDTSLLANSQQQYDGKICNSTIMWNQCGNQPSQGTFDFAAYSFTHWQYIDLLVYWAGSANEGLICPPSATWTDAAHQNGVRILGQVFLNYDWGCAAPSRAICDEMWKTENGHHPFAKKMYEIAAYYGFDGWFINEEFNGGSDEQYRSFIEDYYYWAEQAGDMDQMIQYYNAGGSPARTIVDDHANTSQFLEYGAQYHASNAAEYMKYFNGLETVRNGLQGGSSLFKNLFNKDGHTGSIDLFCPEEHIWKDALKANNVDTENYNSDTRTGTAAYTAQATIFDNEADYFVNPNHDPTNISSYSGWTWPGFATTVAERSAIQSKPFFTAFSTGLGKQRFVDGVAKGTGDYCHLGTQDILPTWRWWIEGGELSADYDWSDAYQLSNSIKFTGSVTANTDHHVRLFKTHISVSATDKFTFVYKTNTPNSVKLELGTVSGNHSLVAQTPSTTSTNNGWTVAEFDLSSLAGETLSVIAVNFNSAASKTDYSASLGQLLLTDGQSITLSAVQNITLQNPMGQSSGDISLLWDAPATGADKVHHYDVYTVRNGVKTLAGQTKQTGFWLPTVSRTSATDAGVSVEIVPIAYDQTAGTSAVTDDTKFSDPTTPNVRIECSKTLLAVDEATTFTAVADLYPTAYSWDVPSNATDVTYNADHSQMTCKFSSEGWVDVTAHVTNAVGTTDYTENHVAKVLNGATLDCVSVGKTIDSASYEGSHEGPQYLIDGVNIPGSTSQKWCTNAANPWVIIDLEQPYNLYRFDIYDCQLKEGGANVDNYDIYTSMDKVTWTKVVSKTNNGVSTHNDWCKPTVGRYIKWDILWDSPMTIRVWEFAAFGMAGGPIVDAGADKTVNVGATSTFTANINLNDDSKASDFAVDIQVDNSKATVSNITPNAEGTQVSYDITGVDTGNTDVKIVVTNNGWEKYGMCHLSVDDPSLANVLLNVAPTEAKFLYRIRSGNEYWRDITDFTNITDGDVATVASYTTSQSYCKTAKLKYELADFYEVSKLTVYNPSDYANMKVLVSDVDDDTEYTEIHSSEQLTSSGESYYFNKQVVKYIKFEFSTSASGTYNLQELEVFGKLKTGYTPIILTQLPMAVQSGFTNDLIVEGSPAANFSDGKLDDQGWNFYTKSYDDTDYMTETRDFVSANGISFNFADFASANSLLLSENSTKTGTLSFVKRYRGKKLYILSTNANGSASVDVTVHYEDGTQSDVQSINLLDWYGNAGSAVAKAGVARVSLTDNIDRRSFRLFEHEIAIDLNKVIETVEFTTHGRFSTIFAVTCKGQEVAGEKPTIINGVESDNLSVYPNPVKTGESLNIETVIGAQLSIYNIHGQMVSNQVADREVMRVSTTLVSGTYVIVQRTNTSVVTTKLVVL